MEKVSITDDDLAISNADSHLELMDQLETLRNHLNLQLSDIAQALDISEEEAAELESGTSNPSTALVDRFAVAVDAYVMRIAIPKYCMKEWENLSFRITEILQKRPWIEIDEIIESTPLDLRQRSVAAPWNSAGEEIYTSRSHRDITEYVSNKSVITSKMAGWS